MPHAKCDVQSNLKPRPCKTEVHFSPLTFKFQPHGRKILEFTRSEFKLSHAQRKLHSLTTITNFYRLEPLRQPISPLEPFQHHIDRSVPLPGVTHGPQSTFEVGVSHAWSQPQTVTLVKRRVMPNPALNSRSRQAEAHQAD